MVRDLNTPLSNIAHCDELIASSVGDDTGTNTFHRPDPAFILFDCYSCVCLSYFPDRYGLTFGATIINSMYRSWVAMVKPLVYVVKLQVRLTFIAHKNLFSTLLIYSVSIKFASGYSLVNPLLIFFNEIMNQ